MEEEGEDYELVQNVISGFPKAFESLVLKYQRLSWSIISRMVSNPEDVRDLNQECFLQVYRYLHTFRFESSLGAWIAHVAHSTACKFIRKKRAIALPDSDIQNLIDSQGHESDVVDILIHGQSARHLRVALDQLCAIERTILRMHYFEEMSVAEISDATGLAQGTVKSHLSRSRAKLKLALAEVA